MYKKMFVVMILVAAILSGCGNFPLIPSFIKGSGNTTSEVRQVTGFTSIVLASSTDVNIKYGPANEVVVTADDSILPLIQTVVENNQLIIRTKPGTTISFLDYARVDVTVTSLTVVSVSGSGTMDVSGIDAKIFSATLPGSGNINLSGVANTTTLLLGGSGSIDASQLKSKNATATVGGSGNLTVYANESLNASINGSGSIRISGNPAQVNKEVRGSGKIYQ